MFLRFFVLIVSMFFFLSANGMTQIEELASCASGNVRISAYGVVSFTLTSNLMEDGSTLIMADQVSLDGKEGGKTQATLPTDGSLRGLFEDNVPDLKFEGCKLKIIFNGWNCFPSFSIKGVEEIEVCGSETVPFFDTAFAFPNLKKFDVSKSGFFWMRKPPQKVNFMMTDLSVAFDRGVVGWYLPVYRDVNQIFKHQSLPDDYKAEVVLEGLMSPPSKSPDVDASTALLSSTSSLETSSSSASPSSATSSAQPLLALICGTDLQKDSGDMASFSPEFDLEGAVFWHNIFSPDKKTVTNLKTTHVLCGGAFFMAMPPEMRDHIFSFLTPIEALPAVKVMPMLVPHLKSCHGSWSTTRYQNTHHNFISMENAFQDLINHLHKEMESTFDLCDSQSASCRQSVHQTITSAPLWKTETGF